MLTKTLENFKNNSFKTPKSIFLFGLLIAFAIALKEVINFSFNNFLIFYHGSVDFWDGVNPYREWRHLNYKGAYLSAYLYLPLFSILFTPFTLVPHWLGVILWNTFTYSMFYLAIFNLPDKYPFKEKKFIFFISALLLFATILSMQFNPLIAAFFLFAYSALERDRPILAITIILISGFTKVYGIFQLSMLISYPKFWRNVGYTILLSAVFFLAPLVKLDFQELLPYYKTWVDRISNHSHHDIFYSIYRSLKQISTHLIDNASIISAVILLILFVLGLIKMKEFKQSFSLRAKYLGILMSYVILFGLGSELHTYVIAIVGYAIWYLHNDNSKLDKILLWINFFLLAVFPVDFLCPVVISNFILGKLNLGAIVFLLTWCIMIYKTFFVKNIHKNKIPL